VCTKKATSLRLYQITSIMLLFSFDIDCISFGKVLP
jgi:hypothetical protein